MDYSYQEHKEYGDGVLTIGCIGIFQLGYYLFFIDLRDFRGMDTHSGEVTLSNCSCLPSEKEYTLKRKEFGPYFLFSRPLFRRGLVYRKANKKSQKLSPLSITVIIT